MIDITELTGVTKHANQHRLSRLIIEAPNDELRQLAVEVEQYTDQLIEALEKAQQRNAKLESSGAAPGILRCTECSFVQTKNIISVTADTITTVEIEPEPCPNGCGQLQPVTGKCWPSNSCSLLNRVFRICWKLRSASRNSNLICLNGQTASTMVLPTTT